jgi:hypothetical protein
MKSRDLVMWPAERFPNDFLALECVWRTVPALSVGIPSLIWPTKTQVRDGYSSVWIVVAVLGLARFRCGR